MLRRRADTPKKYEHIDFTPPEGAANAATKGLEYREKASPSNKGGLTPAEASKEGIGSGVQRAVNLKNRNTLSPDTIKQMHGFFSRHEQNKGIAPENKGEPWNDKGHVSWLLWGGDAAKSWVDKVLGQMEKADEKEKANSKKAVCLPRVASTTGDGSEVGFFLPLSADLASQYEVKAEDTSPPHVTFLYVGKVAPEQVPTLLRVAQGVLSTAPSVFGVLNGVDSFVKKEKDQRVLYSRVSFSHDLKPLRDRLWAALTEAGFKVEQAFPNFTPHVTIEYRDGVNDAVLDMAPPSGSWDCTTVEVWGLPRKYVLPFGGGMTRTASGQPLSLDDLGYGNLTAENEGMLLAPSSVFPADVLAYVPQVPCPENSSEETRRELAHLLKLQRTARPYLAQQVAVTDENATATLEAYCAKHGLDASGVLPVTDAARPVLLQLKRYYDRPRPYQLAAHLEPAFHPMSSTTAHTPSYPSGHSAQAMLVALLLSGLYPDHRDAFMALAQEVSTHRMVGGYHFPSDVMYGEQVGHALYASMARASVRTAAAKYKEKKQVPKADGSGKTTVYVYSERQVANRHREKAERLEDFKPALAELRAQVKKDLDSDDPKKGLVALAVGLIDATYERVGNEDSADKGHYGVTGWLRKHVTFKGKRAVIRYVGKSGVKHEKSVDDEALVGALKKCCGDKDGEEPVLSLGKHTVTSDEVNEYLKPYDITAKDLRGLHANREMQERLRAIRSKGPKLPRLRKERDPILKEEFKQALEGAAEAVGHEPATLRKQYLVPGIEKSYMKDGTVSRDLTASTRVAALYLQATKTDAEREDEEAERLLKPEPKYKPPRGDLRRRRVETERDADPDKAQDDKDRSQNYKDASTLPSPSVSASDVRLVVQTVPWEATTSYRRGTVYGPASMLEAAEQVDLFDTEYGDIWSMGLALLPEDPRFMALNAEAEPHALAVLDDLSENTSNPAADLAKVNRLSEEVNARVYATTRAILDMGKVPALVGGDHSVSFGAIRAITERYPNVGILHIDAHADLRNAYEGFVWSHASIMFNALTRLDGVGRLVQVGLRDVGAPEVEYMARDSRVHVFFDSYLSMRLAEGARWVDLVEEIIEALPPTVYVSFDIDGMEPSECPSTGTPVPGGLTFRDVQVLLRLLSERRHIVGFDLTEPGPDDGNVAARVFLKLCGATLHSHKKMTQRSSMQRVAAAWLFRTAASKKQQKERLKRINRHQKEVRKEKNRTKREQAEAEATAAKAPAAEAKAPAAEAKAPKPVVITERKRKSPTAEPAAPAPKADAPKADAPKADAPKADAPKADAPKADEPKSEGSGDADEALKERAQNEFDSYKEKHPDTELDVSDFLKRLKAKAKHKSEKKEGDADEGDPERDAAELKQAEAERKAERVKQAVKDIAAEWDGAENSVPMTEGNHEKISDAIKSFTPKDREAFVKAFTAQRKKMVAGHKGYDPEVVKDALTALKRPLKDKNPERVASKAVQAIFADRVLLNPLLLTPDNPLSSEVEKPSRLYSPLNATPRVKQAMGRFSKASNEEISEMSERVAAALTDCDKGSPQHEELSAIQFSLNALKALPRKAVGKGTGAKGEKGEGESEPPEGMSGVEFGLLKHLHAKEQDLSELVSLAYRSSRKDGGAANDTRKFVQDTVKDMSMEELNDILPEELHSVSAALLSMRKSLPFHSKGLGALLPGGAEKQRRKRDEEISKREAEITNELRTTLVDCMSEVAVKKADPKTTSKAAKAVTDYIKNNPAPVKKPDEMKDWFADLRAAFMEWMNGGKTAALRHGGESPTVRGYTFLPLPHSVGGLYPH